jgi:tetratricopeptide (TPR) repeat protein
LRSERAARRWSQTDAVNALRAHAGREVPGVETMRRNWKRWEAGTAKPDAFYQPLIAKTFGTATAAFFPPDVRRPDQESRLIAATGMDTLEIVSRIRASDVSSVTLEALRITADRLCCDYPTTPSEQLRIEGQAWLRRITSLLDRRLTLAQHHEILSLAGTVALLLGCVEYDTGRVRAAESTRRAALSLVAEAGDTGQMGWAHEMRAWYSLTQGDYAGVIAAAETGRAITRRSSAAVQLAAQQAKAWARIGDRRRVEVSLSQGREILDALPYPDDLDNHFVVDPSKFDFYTMDCYRRLGEDSLAASYATEVIHSSADTSGADRKPMRTAEAKITLGVVAARSGDLERATEYGQQALIGERKSLPSLLMVSQELVETLKADFPDEPRTVEYLQQLRDLSEI